MCKEIFRIRINWNWNSRRQSNTLISQRHKSNYRSLHESKRRRRNKSKAFRVKKKSRTLIQKEDYNVKNRAISK
nr:MAG TPA: hypothetical protein [Caudoviricetes sp.]